MSEYKVGSLFAGVGGICLGFQNAKTEKSNYKLVWANEIDEFACTTYRNNFKHTLLEGDIKKVLHPELIDKEIEEAKKEYENAVEEEKEKKLEILSKLKHDRDEQFERYSKLHEKILSEPIDVLNGGFPCQAFSIAGEQKGFEDERGNLFLNIVDLIEQLGEKFYKPRILFLENVKNLQAHDKGRTYKVIKAKLEECGYTIYEHVLNTMDYSNLPQNRERIYIIGFLNKEDAEKFNTFNPENLIGLKKIKSSEDRANDVKAIIDYTLTKENSEKYYYTREKYPHYFMTPEEFEKSDKNTRINLEEQVNEMYQFYQCRRGMYVRKNMSDVCPTLTANMGTGGHNVPLIKVADGVRKLTPAETFKLQGFPVGDGYVLPTTHKGKAYSDAQLYKQAGNAVSVPVITMLANEILKTIE
jgi:DNA (cytosine-5)-methyltransferase 1